jgi:hypothetical protein
MACLLPFRPWLSPDLRVFSLEVHRRFRILIAGSFLSCTSTPPQRLNFLRAAHLPVSHADHEPLSVSTSLCAFGPTAYADPETPFFAFFRRRPPGFTLPAGGPAPRVWLPFQRPSVSKPWEVSFNSQRSWASPFRAFLRPGDREAISRSPLRPRALLQNLSALYRRLGGLLPPGQPHP